MLLKLIYLKDATSVLLTYWVIAWNDRVAECCVYQVTVCGRHLEHCVTNSSHLKRSNTRLLAKLRRSSTFSRVNSRQINATYEMLSHGLSQCYLRHVVAWLSQCYLRHVVTRIESMLPKTCCHTDWANATYGMLSHGLSQCYLRHVVTRIEPMLPTTCCHTDWANAT